MSIIDISSSCLELKPLKHYGKSIKICSPSSYLALTMHGLSCIATLLAITRLACEIDVCAFPEPILKSLKIHKNVKEMKIKTRLRLAIFSG